jgi:hypothetical protein
MPKPQPERPGVAATAAADLAAFNGRRPSALAHQARVSIFRQSAMLAPKCLADPVQLTYRAAQDFPTASAYIGGAFRHRLDSTSDDKAFNFETVLGYLCAT